MSRWVNYFESHAFQPTWTQIKSNLEKATVDDKTVVTDVEELARLNKVIAYLDELIRSIDPEILPASTWDQYQAQAAPCNAKIVQYINDRNMAHIKNANAHADNLLTYIKPYMVAKGGAATAMQKAAKAYSKLVNDYMSSFKVKSEKLLTEIEIKKNSSEELIDSMRSVNNNVEKLDEYLFGDNNKELGVKDQVENLVEDFETKYQSINEFHDETLVGDEDTSSTKMMILRAKEIVLKEQKDIAELLSLAKDELQNLDEFHNRIFGELDEEEEKRIGGLKQELDLRINELTVFEALQIKKFKALNDEIESLIPGATDAGLATAYKDMKKSFDTPIKNSSLLFYGSIGILIVGTLILSIDTISDGGVTFVKNNDWPDILRSFAYKIPFYGPAIWLALYATKRRSESQRLQQEYAHKEAVAKSYSSYKKQILDLGDEDKAMQKDLINKALETIAHNASTTLDGDHGDNMPAKEIIEQFIDAATKMKPLM